jgi:hypothetical protein
LELLLCDNAESIPWVVANGHVHSDICLWMLHVQLYWPTANGEVGALLLNVVEASAGEVALSVIGKPTRRGNCELEMGKRKR